MGGPPTTQANPLDSNPSYLPLFRLSSTPAPTIPRIDQGTLVHRIILSNANLRSDQARRRYIYIYSYIFLGQAYLEIEKHASLGIKISGACCKLPDPTDTIDFESFVREKQTRSVIIMNDSNAPWRLKIEVKGDYFSADQLLQVPPLQLAPCVVTYAPVSMNTDETLDTVRR